MTPAEVGAVCKAFHDAEDQRDRGAWERSRIMAYSNVSPYFGKGKKMKPQQFLPLPWDKEDIRKRAGKHDNRAAIQQLARLLNG